MEFNTHENILDDETPAVGFSTVNSRRQMFLDRMSNPNSTPLTADIIYEQMLRESTRGQKLVTLKAPALATQFVKAADEKKAQPNREGALFEIHIPSWSEIEEKNRQNHGEKLEFGYTTTAATDAFPGGYGERSALAMQREDNIYQLKGTFPSAALALSKLKARIEARQGNVAAVDELFSKLWGLTVDETETLPHFHLAGSEPTRMSASEDRAYHALACHPSSNGGYRADMATVTPHVLGPDVPMNWARLRTGIKAIALGQMQGDAEIYRALQIREPDAATSFTMNITQGSQPRYARSYAWESMLNDMLKVDADVGYTGPDSSQDVGHTLMMSMARHQVGEVARIVQPRITKGIKAIADTVSNASRKSLERTVDIMELYERERALITEYKEEEFEDYDQSEVARTFDVPARKVTRNSMKKGFEREKLGPSGTPDMVASGKGSLRVDRAEFRDAGVSQTMSLASALNLAVYLTINAGHLAPSAYRLLRLLPDPDPSKSGPIARKLRDQRLYDNPEIWALGGKLFGETFMNRFELLIRNVTMLEDRDHSSVKRELWHYLSSRCAYGRPCPVEGGWRDVLEFVLDQPEGWLLYYWARVSIGKLQRAATGGILAPIAAGDEVDLLTLLKKGIKERALNWASFYTQKYQEIEGAIDDRRTKKAKQKAAEAEGIQAPLKYIPPAMRKSPNLDDVYDAEQILNRPGGYEEEEYRKMVEYQVKAKVFAKIKTHTLDRRLSVGISDSQLLEMLLEFYQARWYSLHKRIEARKKKGEVFHLGKWPLPEHPWGELVVEPNLPKSVADMLDFMLTLDPRAWTVSPQTLWAKILKSINELWEDIANELNQIIEYIESVEEDLDDVQSERLLQRQSQHVTSALSDVPAIVLPVAGFRPMRDLPEKVVVTSKGKEYLRTSEPLRIDDNTNDISADQALAEWEDDDEDWGFAENKHENLIPTNLMEESFELVTSSRYLTYREIWDSLGLHANDDMQIRYAFALPYDADLSAEQMDSQIGPALLLSEREHIFRAWSKKLPTMKKRLGIAEKQSEHDDM